MSEIDIQQMIEMAREREGWTQSERTTWVVDSNRQGLNKPVAHMLQTTDRELEQADSNFIAQSPLTILALSERVAELEAQIKALTPEPMPACYRCGGTGSITYFGEGADEGHDIDLNCPVCNPKHERYNDDRDYPEDYD